MSAFASLGCDAPETSERPPIEQRAVSGHGVVRGRVRFIGTPPVMNNLDVTCHDGLTQVTAESVVVNGNGTLRNVFVYLEGAPASPAGADARPALLDQVNCRFMPHVVGVQVGQKLAARSSDPTLHNVHGLATRNRAFNFGMTGAGQEKSVAFTEPEFITVKCDVHPWMSAYVGVFENAWFDVTGDSGSFEIRGIPAGSFKLVAWHEHYGRLEKDVTIRDDGGMEADFEYKAP